MVLMNDKVILRDFKESDIEKRIYWEIAETQWQLYDAPWEYENMSDEQKRKSLNDYIEHMHEWVKRYESMTDETERTGFQICIKNDSEEYIGWCNSYFIDDDCNFSETGNKCTIGIDIPERSAHSKGYASSALQLFIDYLFSCGKKEIYTQTWSGNIRMIHLANKLGFEEFKRKQNLRIVRGQKYDGLTFRLNHKLYQKLKESSFIS